MDQEAKRMRFSEGAAHEQPEGRSHLRTKPCTKFFSTAGCPYGDSCHFLHYAPGASMSSPGTSKLVTQAFVMETPATSKAAPPEANSGYKTKLCNRFSTAEGCRFGKNCNFAHGEAELRPVNSSTSSRQAAATSGFSVAKQPAVSTSRITVKAAFVGAIIGKAGANVKEIIQTTGAKVSIREHDTDPSLRNVEMVGSMEQIEDASEMVQKIVQQLPQATAPTTKGNFKTRMCQKFSFGACTFGDRCHFAHSQEELRRTE